MAAIFQFSSQPAVDSAAVSKGLLYRILRFIAAPVFSNESDIPGFVQAADGVFRKCAHFSIYIVFGIFMFFFIREFNVKKPFLISVPLVFIYAVSDEIHQYFIPGRSCEFRDMMIDLSGAVLGTLIIYLIKKRSLWK